MPPGCMETTKQLYFLLQFEMARQAMIGTRPSSIPLSTARVSAWGNTSQAESLSLLSISMQVMVIKPLPLVCVGARVRGCARLLHSAMLKEMPCASVCLSQDVLGREAFALGLACTRVLGVGK